MKAIKRTAAVAISALAVMALGSCQKSDLKPENPVSAVSAADHNLKKPVYDAGIRSNQGYPSTGTTDRAYYRLYYNTALGQQPIVNYGFGGDAGSTIRGYTAGPATEIFAYNLGGYNVIDYNGSDNLIMNGASYFTGTIEEIEMDPGSGYVYALCKVGYNSIQVWRIDPSTGAAVQMLYGTTPTFFYNPVGNGYKSGSLAFVPDGSGGYYMVLSSESTVYASLGIVCWYFTISGTTASVVSSLSKTFLGLPATGTTGGTGINTTYGDGKMYFARDAGEVYSLPTTGSGASTGTDEGFSVTNANDFGYWKNF